jgi:hypothetical protein
MTGMMQTLSRYLLCLLVFNLAACSSMQAVDLQRAVQTSNARGVEYGRLVDVRMLDGERAKFRVTEMNDQGIGNGEAFYRFADMESLKVENPNSNSSEETVTWVLGVIGFIALIALAVNSDSVSVCSPGPCPEDQ